MGRNKIAQTKDSYINPKYIKIRQKPIKMNLDLPENLQPEDLGKMAAEYHAEMILNDYIPSNYR